MILLIDNYDSFSYNLYQLIGEINPDIKVIRNDEMTVEEIRPVSYTHLAKNSAYTVNQGGTADHILEKLYSSLTE